MTLTTLRPRRSVLYMPGRQRAGAREGQGHPCRRAHPRPRGRRRPRRQGRGPRPCVRRCRLGRVRRQGDHDPGQRARHRVARRRPRRGRAKAGPDAIVVPKVNSAAEVAALIDALEAAGAPDHTKLWAMLETPVAMLARRGDRHRLRPPDRAGDGHQRPGQGAPRRARARAGSRCSTACRPACWPPVWPAR